MGCCCCKSLGAPAGRPAAQQDQEMGDLTYEAEDTHGWTAAAWASSVGVSEDVAQSLLLHNPSSNELRATRMVARKVQSKEALCQLLRAGHVVEKLSQRLYPALCQLDAPQNPSLVGYSKFVQDGSAFTLKFGELNAFFSGLEGKVGPPDPKVSIAMERDHTAGPDSCDQFVTSNYMVTTTPSIEWTFVVGADLERDWPTERLSRIGINHMRRPMPMAQLMAKLHEFNQKLILVSSEQLIVEEAIAARLYTGPMFVKYNDILRGFGAALATCKGNTYRTTLHAINSAIVKASKVTIPVKVYRGISGGVLPDDFTGGVELGFMSTTSQRSVAWEYASRPGSPGLVFEIQMGMIDRGADLSWISQYPYEAEILFGPLTGLEISRRRVDGASLIVEARININLNSLTLEQVIGKRRKMVVDASKDLVQELQHVVKSSRWEELSATVSTNSAEVAMECLKGSYNILSQPVEYYNDNSSLRTALGDLVLCRMSIGVWPEALDKLSDLLQMPVQQLLRAASVDAGRKQIFYAESCGLVALMLLSSRLTELDIQWNSLYEDGGCMLGIALSFNKSLHKLDLNTNWVGEKAGIWLGKALATNSSLLFLNVSYNKIGEAGGVSFGEALASNTTLQHLDLSMNEIGDKAAVAIARGLGMNNTLSILHLRINGLTSTCVPSLSAALSENTTLAALHLDGNSFDESDHDVLVGSCGSHLMCHIDNAEWAGMGPAFPVSGVVGPALPTDDATNYGSI